MTSTHTTTRHLRVPLRAMTTVAVLIAAMIAAVVAALAVEQPAAPDVRAAGTGVTPLAELAPSDAAMVEQVDSEMARFAADRALIRAVDAQLVPAQISAERIAMIDANIEAYAVPAEDSTWDRLADCESGDWGRSGPIAGSARWDYGVGYSHGDIFEGGLNFHPRTWDNYRDDWMPSRAGEASRADQIRVARRVLADQGWRAWPVCSRMIGLR